MSTENSNTKFKILIGVLSGLLIILAVYTVTLYNDSKNTVMGLEKQKGEIENELSDLIANYDELIKDNELKDNELLAARERIENLLDSVKRMEANVGLIARYRAELDRLKTERKMLFKRADSLIAANQLLAIERDSTNMALTNTIRVVDSVTSLNTEMAETIKKGSVVNAVDLRGEAVILRKSGKIVDTRRASRADKVRACFTLTPNPIAQKGERTLYIQVINPKNNLLGEKGELQVGDQVLNYSTITNVFYENEELDVCVLVDTKEEDLIPGRYSIHVFDSGVQVANATMTLK